MVNYNKSTIYKLCCKDTEITDEYVGSTTNFNRRKACHKSKCHSETGHSYNYRVYECIRDNGGWDNWDMVEIEKYCASDKNDLHKRERYWIEILKSNLNKQIPSKTKDEIKEYQKEYWEEYYEKNQEKIKEYASTKVVCECGAEITRGNLPRHKRSGDHTNTSNH